MCNSFANIKSIIFNFYARKDIEVENHGKINSFITLLKIKNIKI